MKPSFVFPCAWILLCLACLWVSRPSYGEQIVVWHQKGGASPVLTKILEPIARKYNADLSVVYISTTDLKTALIKSVLNKNEPNIALVPSDFFGEKDTFNLQPISDSLRHNVTLDPHIWNFAKLNDVVYGIPLALGNHLVLYYNKAYVETPINDWQQLFELSKPLPKNKHLIGWNYTELFWFINFVAMFGEMPVNNNQITLQTPAMAKALKFYRELSHQGIVDGTCDYACSSQRFEAGEFVYTINGDWAYRSLKSQLGDNLGVTALPKYKNMPMKSIYSAIAMIFPGSDQDERTTAINEALAQALLTDEAQTKLFKTTGVLPADRRLREHLIGDESSNYADVINVLDSGIAMPSTPAMAAAWAGMRKGFDYYYENDVSEARALSIMQSVAQRQLETLQGRE